MKKKHKFDRYMSLYPPPENTAPIFNPSSYIADSSSLTIETGDKRYLKLSGGIETGLVTFNAGVSVTGGNVAMTSGTGSFHARNGSISNPSFAFQNDQTTGSYRVGAGNIGWSCASSRQMDLDSSRLSLVGNLALEKSGFKGTLTETTLTADRTYTLPDSSGTISLSGDLANYATLNGSQTIQNKTFQTSSNSSIASFTSTTITTSFPHNLAVDDVITFPNIGSLSGVSVGTNYTIESVPSVTQFTLTGVTLSGSLSVAFYVLVSRATANQSTNGGSLSIIDPSNPSNGLYFDVSGSSVPTVFRCQAGVGGIPITFPSFGGTVATLNNTQIFGGNKSFSGQIISTRAGQTTSANAPFLTQPSTTVMTGSNSYYWSYFSTPPTSGSSTGTVSTVVIQGAPTGATNNYSLQILAGAVSYPSGAVASPSIVFGTSNSSGFYSSSANVLNASISGVNILSVSNTGLTISGNTQSSTQIQTPIWRANSGTLARFAPATDLTNGTCQLRVTPSAVTQWITGGVATLELGDANHSVSSTNGTGITINSVDSIRLGSSGSGFKNMRYGTTTYGVPLSAGSATDVAVSFGVTFSSTPVVIVSMSGASGSAFWGDCCVGAIAISTTAFDARIRNLSGSTTSGNALITWIAFNN